MKTVVMALTNVDHYLEYPERKTGVWLEEAANFYKILTAAGIEVVAGRIHILEHASWLQCRRYKEG